MAGDLFQWGNSNCLNPTYAMCYGFADVGHLLLLVTQPQNSEMTWLTDLPPGAELIHDDGDRLLLRPCD